MPYSAPSMASTIVVISDLFETHDNALPTASTDANATTMFGGYLERLPLAAVLHGMVERAEIWHHRAGPTTTPVLDGAHLTRRAFHADSSSAPYHSSEILEFIERHGAPAILCVWGLGVSEAILEACSDSVIIYNSIDVPPLRVPANISAHFDLVLTAADWQADFVRDRHPSMATAVLPIGPEFASPETFYPLAGHKPYDVVYVAAALAYKRHDLLFAALRGAPRPLKALCVMGYGEDAQMLRDAAQGLDVDFVGPPGVSHAEVNRLMNLAHVGVVCGVDDGAPAILTEYMLAGLPVVANAALKCGLHYVTEQTGVVAPADRFGEAIIAVLDAPESFNSRQAVLDHWAWPHSIARLKGLLDIADPRKSTIHTSGAERPEGGSIESSTFV